MDTSLWAAHAIDWALANGLVIRPPATLLKEGEATAHAIHAPFALTPTLFPRDCYNLALQLQPLFNQLVDIIADDYAFLHESLKDVLPVDDFTRRLFDLYTECHTEGFSTDIHLGCHRSDYLLHQPTFADTPKLQQVELNTMASSFSHLSSVVSRLHTYLNQRMDLDADLPDNERADTSIPDAIALAHKLYGNVEAYVMMLVQDSERNRFDQRGIEYQLLMRHNVKLVRCTLSQLFQHGRRDEVTKALVYDNKEISVVYFRAGYHPADYPSEDEWQARRMLERSKAVKCPSISYHLTGTKKIQQVLAVPGVLEKFTVGMEVGAGTLLRLCFTGLYPVDEEMDRALLNPERYVMKPQREGGGNNLYDDQVKDALLTMTPEERQGYILMDRITPRPQVNWLVRAGQITETQVVSELGVYGVYVSQGTTVHLNSSGGHLLRTKAAETNEGGVAVGFAVMDSPRLY